MLNGISCMIFIYPGALEKGKDDMIGTSLLAHSENDQNSFCFSFPTETETGFPIGEKRVRKIFWCERKGRW